MNKEELIQRLQDIEWEDFEVKEAKSELVDDNRQLEVLREAWVNMLMHTDHFSPLRSCIHVFTDRIEFLNAGCFPIPPDRIYGTFFSQSRNPTIAKLFRFAHLAENAGFGIDKLRSWKSLTGKEITIRAERDYVLVTFGMEEGSYPVVPSPYQARTQLAPSLHPACTQLAPSLHPVCTQLSSSDAERAAAVLLACMDSALSMQDIVSLLNVSTKTRFRRNVLTPLLESGLLEATIKDIPNSPNQRYVLTTKGRSLIEKAQEAQRL